MEGPVESIEGGHGEHARDHESRKGGEAAPAGATSASRRAEAPSRHRRDSSLGEEVVAGLFFDFEAVRTDLTEMPRAGDAFRAGHVIDRLPALRPALQPEGRGAPHPEVPVDKGEAEDSYERFRPRPRPAIGGLRCSSSLPLDVRARPSLVSVF